jgi:hypothetical protein
MHGSTLAKAIRVAAISCLLASTTIAAPASAASNREVRPRDDCEATSFNAVLGAGACVGNGGTTLDEFNAELARRQSVGAWKYNPDHTNVNSGEHILVVSRGGETHTFTQVRAFGGGFVAPLNQAAGNLVPAPECASVQPDGSLRPQPPSATNMFVAGQTQAAGPSLGRGTFLFQCCIHPWMHMTIEQR